MTPLLPWAACASVSPPAQLWAHGNNLLISLGDFLPFFFQVIPWISPLKKPNSSLQMTNAAVLWIFLLASLRIKTSLFPWSLCPRQPPAITPPAVLSCSQTAGSVDASPGWLLTSCVRKLCPAHSSHLLQEVLIPAWLLSDASMVSNISITLLSLLLHKSPSLLSLREQTKGPL